MNKCAEALTEYPATEVDKPSYRREVVYEDVLTILDCHPVHYYSTGTMSSEWIVGAVCVMP